MNYALKAALATLVVAAAGITDARAVDPGTTWLTMTPAQAGLDVTKLNELPPATGWTSGSAMRGAIIKDGYLVYSWGDVARRGDWASSMKPVMSTMLWYAIQEGRTTGVNDRVYRFGWPTTVPDQSITWMHLGSMTSGYALPENPGARWGYNDYAISLYCRTLFTQSGDSISVFGQTMAQVVATRFSRLQFQDGGVIGSGRLGCQLFASTRDFARIGWWWLNKGLWRGVQMLPRSYFDSFMKNQVSSSLPRTAGGALDDYLHVGTVGGTGEVGANQNILGQGRYGFNWTFNRPKVTWPSAPADTFQARGHHNAEMMLVIPSLRMLLVCGKCRQSTDAATYSDADRYLKLLMEARQ